MDNMELLVNGQAQKENDIHKVEQELAAKNVQVNQNNIIAQQNKEEKKEDAHEEVFENININGMLEKDEEQHANVGAMNENHVKLGKLNVNSFVQQKTSDVELNANIKLDEAPVYVEKSYTAEVDHAEQFVSMAMPRPIKLTRMQRFARKMGFGTRGQRLQYKRYLRREKDIKNIKALHGALGLYKNIKVAKIKKDTKVKLKSISSMSKKQGKAFAENGLFNNKNEFLLKMQKQGEEDNLKISDEGRDALQKYKAETNGASVDYVAMNTLLRTKKFSSEYKGNGKDCMEVYKENQDKEKEKKLSKYQLKKSQCDCKDTIKATTDAINTLNKFSLRQEMTLYRYAGTSALKSMLGLKSDATERDIDERLKVVGKKEVIMRDKAFLSTAMFKDAAESFKKGLVHFRILGHEGTKAYNISRLTELEKKDMNFDPKEYDKNDDLAIYTQGGKYGAGQNGEQEMLLQAGTQLRVLKVETQKLSKAEQAEAAKKDMKCSKRYIVYVETIPQEVKKASKKNNKKG